MKGVVLVVVGVCMLGACGDDPGDPPDAAPVVHAAAPSPAPTPEPTRPPEAAPWSMSEPQVGEGELAEAYLACVRDRGFDPGAAQVIVVDGVPVWVKAGREVPARFHRPCLVALGGPDPLSSSYGYPVGLGECGGLDRDPPIDWSPAPPQPFADSVVQPVASTDPGGVVRLVWADEPGQRLTVPEEPQLECWNGQEWTDAFRAVLDIGGSAATLRVPMRVPPGLYRVIDTAERCTTDGERECTTVPFAFEFLVTNPWD